MQFIHDGWYNALRYPCEMTPWTLFCEGESQFYLITENSLWEEINKLLKIKKIIKVSIKSKKYELGAATNDHFNCLLLFWFLFTKLISCLVYEMS